MSMRSMSWIPRLVAVIVLISPATLLGQTREFPYSLGCCDVALALGGGALLALGMYQEGQTPNPTDADLISTEEVWSFDRWATRQSSDGWDTLSDYLVYGGIASVAAVSLVPLIAEKEWTSRRNFITMAVIGGEAFLLSQGASKTAKGTFRRRRPYVHNQDLSLERKKELAGSNNDAFKSFFSGHATTAFVLATFGSTVFADVVEAPPWAERLVWAGTLSAAALTAYARVAAGKHYASDVIVGALVGSAIGHLVPRSHRRGGGAGVGGGASVNVFSRGAAGVGIGIEIPTG